MSVAGALGIQAGILAIAAFIVLSGAMTAETTRGIDRINAWSASLFAAAVLSGIAAAWVWVVQS